MECLRLRFRYMYLFLSFLFVLIHIRRRKSSRWQNVKLHNVRKNAFSSLSAINLVFIFFVAAFFFANFRLASTFLREKKNNTMKLWNIQSSQLDLLLLAMPGDLLNNIYGFSEIFYALSTPLFSTLIRLIGWRWNFVHIQIIVVT